MNPYDLSQWPGIGGRASVQPRKPTVLGHVCECGKGRRIAELEAENAELRKDRARLDWIEKNHADIYESIDGGWCVWLEDTTAAFAYPSARAAIDAAMKG